MTDKTLSHNIVSSKLPHERGSNSQLFHMIDIYRLRHCFIVKCFFLISNFVFYLPKEIVFQISTQMKNSDKANDIEIQ